MKYFIRNSVAIAGLVAALSGVAAHAAYLPPSFHDFGSAADDNSFVDRVVKITPQTKSIGLYRMQVVKFIDEQTGKSFLWRFNTFHAGNFPLADIAPAGVLAGEAVQAYVWDSPTGDSQP